MMQTIKRWSVLFDVLVILFLLVFPHIASVPMLIYPAIGLLLIWAYGKITGRSFGSIGFRWKDCTIKSFFTGGLAGVVYALLLFFFIGPLLLKVTGLPPADLKDFYAIRHNVTQYILLLAIAWLWVIPYEEIVFRGFIFSVLRERVSSFWLPMLMSSLLFAGYHYQEGASAVISIFLFAVMALLMYRYYKYNLWYVIFFHAAYDTVMLTLIRMGYL